MTRRSGVLAKRKQKPFTVNELYVFFFCDDQENVFIEKYRTFRLFLHIFILVGFFIQINFDCSFWTE